MAIKRIQQMGVYGVTTGARDEEEIELICCPELDREGYGNPNFPKASCLQRQVDEEWKVPSCYGGCKGRRPFVSKAVATPEQREIRRERVKRARGIEADATRLRIAELHGKGFSVLDISAEINRGKSLVEKRLVELGLVIPRVSGPVSLKQQIMRWLDENPKLKTRDIVAAFPGTPKGTCESYLTQWRKRNKGGR